MKTRPEDKTQHRIFGLMKMVANVIQQNIEHCYSCSICRVAQTCHNWPSLVKKLPNSSQGGVATCLKCDEIFDEFIINSWVSMGWWKSS